MTPEQQKEWDALVRHCTEVYFLNSSNRTAESVSAADAELQRLREQRDVLLAALKEAKTGLEWYQDSYPEATDGSDNETMARIDAAINQVESAA